MTKPKSIWIATVLTIAALPILFLFQNCSSSTQFKIAEASVSANETSPTSDICQPMNEIFGDMRVAITTGSPRFVEFGTFEDNYWHGDYTGESFNRKLELFIPDKSQLTQFKLVHVEFDDWLSLKVNGQIVYVGPYSGDRLERENGAVRFGPLASDVADAELGQNWGFSPNINLLPYLVNGANTFEVRIIVAGSGEGALRFSVLGGDCAPQN